MRRIGMLLAIAVLAGSLLSGCVVEPWGGRYEGGGYFGSERGYYANGRGYHADRGDYPGYPGPNFHRDR